MSIKILMPALSPTMKDGILHKWLVKVGDTVKAGDVLAEIETDKATMEIEAVDEGKITKILVKEGTEGIAVNSPIAVLNNLDSEVEKEDLKNEDNQTKVEDSQKIISEKIIKKNLDYSGKKTTLANKNNKIIASPYAKKLSRDSNINLNFVDGSGPDGRIIKRDLENLRITKEQHLPTSSEFDLIEPSSIRKIIAERTTLTKNTVPHFYLTINSKVDKLLVLRKKINDKYFDNKISINDILVKALAIAQRKNPQTNVSWHNGKIVQYSSVDVSVAVALKEGLITPIIKNADEKGLLEISNEIKLLSKKAKIGKLIPEEYTGGTISISNLGMYGIDEFSAIINPPQSAILAVGSIQKIPYAEDKKIVIAKILKSTLSADHRVLDGAIAANLLKDFHDIIENPFDLWLQSKDMEII